MAVVAEWVLLAYRLPREPSGPRVTVWRKLRRLGAVQLVDGLVALPASSQNREQFDWLADEIFEAGGEAWTFAAAPGSKDQQRALAARLTDTAAENYRALLGEAEALLASRDRPHRRTVERLRRELRRIEDRDPSPPKERAKVRRAVESLSARLDAVDRAVVR
jgi:DNA-binding transcriptional regulator PaaX